MPGHTREGSGKATVWSVDATAYRAHFARRPAPVRTTTDDEAAAEAAIAAAGLRPTRVRAA